MERNVIDRYQAPGLRAISDPAAVGRAIAEERRRLGITQEQLAMSIGVNRRVIGELERGKESTRLGIALQALGAVGLHACVVGDR